MTHPDSSPLALIRQVIAEYSDAVPEDVVPEAELDALNIDSLTLAEMLFALEDKLGVTMAEPAERPKRVSDLMKLLEPYADLIRAKVVAA